MSINKAFPRYTAVLAGIIGLIFAVAPPAAYFALSWQSLRVSLEKEAEINAQKISLFVAANPLMWQFDEIRLKNILEGDNVRAIPEVRIVHDLRGIVATSDDGEPPWPVASRSYPVWDAGTPVGRMEIRISLRPLLRTTAALGGATTLVSAFALTMFFLYPFSALRKALGDVWEMKERAQVTLHSITDGVIATDKGGRILLMNDVAETLTGWTSMAALGKPLGEVFRPDRLEEDRLIETTNAPILDRAGIPAGSVLVLRDVTEKARMQDELMRSDKLESLGILAGGIAHDFNNLLTGVLGNISLAMEMVDSHKRAHSRLEEAVKAALRAKDLAARMLAFSKGGKPICEKISLQEALRDSIGFALRGTGVRCEFRVPEEVWAVYADPGQIGQVFHNLAINAVQAMPGGGHLRVSMENARVRDGEIPHVVAGNYVRIDVADDGIGIPADVLPKIFDPYFTTKEKGSGLGLTTCYTIVKNHKGNIFARSAVGGGTTFRIHLPATGEILPKAAPPREAVALPGSAAVLLMDDEEMVLDVVGEMLAHLGYKPDFARHGEEAIAMYEEAARGAGKFDIVILDLTIPGGMGGKEAASRILGRHPEARIIVSSGYSSDPIMSRFKEHGFAGVIAKPYKLGELSHVLRQVLGKEEEAVPPPADSPRDQILSPTP
ncbi:MAG: ATP-binding protein [bacterium]